MSGVHEVSRLFVDRFGAGAQPQVVSVPGRVNLIGEHIDYHNLPVLPIAIQRRIQIAFRVRADRTIRAVSAGHFGEREFAWTAPLERDSGGDWVNYIKAAAQAVQGRWKVEHGIDAAIVSDLPPAAGLSSSSALLTGFTLALLQANGVSATFEELMDVLPEGEHFVGTRGGGMDHAAVLGARSGCALLIHFAPFSATPVPIPSDWAFLIAHSLDTAEKSGSARLEYNERRTSGYSALQRLGFASYASVIEGRTLEQIEALAAAQLSGTEQSSFLHVAGEAFRVHAAVDALKNADSATFGKLLYASHDSMRDQLRISTAALDRLVEKAREAGALGARLTGAGFGGCAVVFCKTANLAHVRTQLIARFYAGKSGFDPVKHLITAEASAGALFA